MKQLELFPDLYTQPWVCELCEGDTSHIDYDYIGSGYNCLECDMNCIKFILLECNMNCIKFILFRMHYELYKTYII